SLLQQLDHLFFAETTLLHDFLSCQEAILSSFSWSENPRAGQPHKPTVTSCRINNQSVPVSACSYFFLRLTWQAEIPD
ncbi:MAG: hypothetical protein WC247_12955, partial [Porticoccaceae bacterium]